MNKFGDAWYRIVINFTINVSLDIYLSATQYTGSKGVTNMIII